MDIGEIEFWGMHWRLRVAGSCEYCTEPSGSIKSGEFLD
jgi:hypothetical protein